jgi:excisionase family DNA binding protein
MAKTLTLKRSPQKKDNRPISVFTTGEAAEVCMLSQRTVIRSFDQGTLPGFRVPGSRFRRIPAKNLKKFMEDNSIPMERLREKCPELFMPEPQPA